MIVLTVPDQVSIRVYMPLEKRQKFKALAALSGRDMSEIANELIDQWMEQNGTPAGQSGQPDQTDEK